MTDQILLPAVEGAMCRIAGALAHDEAIGRNFHGDEILRLLSRSAAGLDTVIRTGNDDDRAVHQDTVEWIMAAGEAAETMARAAVVLSAVALHEAPPDLDHGTYMVYTCLALALEVGVMAHRPEDGAG